MPPCSARSSEQDEDNCSSLYTDYDSLGRLSDAVDWRFVVSRVPVPMVKTVALRDPLPLWLLSIMKHEHAKLYSGPLATTDVEVDPNGPCCACLATREVAVGSDVAIEAHSYICAICSMLWHLVCARSIAVLMGLSSWVVGEPFSCPACANAGSRQGNSVGAGSSGSRGSPPASMSGRAGRSRTPIRCV